jgi:rhomboid protease GluP
MPDSQRRDDAFSRPIPAHDGNPRPGPAIPQPSRPLLLPVMLIGINIIVWTWSVISGISWLAPRPVDLETWGGNIALLTLTGEPWRLFTSLFMHAGVLHLFVNMYFLLQIGPLLVLRKGSTGFAIVYLTGGLLSSAASAWWQAQILFAQAGAFPGNQMPALRLIVSVGASGAIMAVAGALAWSLVASHYRPDAGSRNKMADKQLMHALLRTIGLNVALGFFIPGLDQAAHVGGLLAGALLGFVLPDMAGHAKGAARWLRRLAAVMTGAVLLLGFLALTNTTQLQQMKTELLQQQTATPPPGTSAP